MSKIFLTSPAAYKGYCLHIHYQMGDGYTRNNIIYLARIVSGDKNIFFQGDNVLGGWMMIEFWTDDHDFILNFCFSLAEKLATELEITNLSNITFEMINLSRLPLSKKMF